MRSFVFDLSIVLSVASMLSARFSLAEGAAGSSRFRAQMYVLRKPPRNSVAFRAACGCAGLLCSQLSRSDSLFNAVLALGAPCGSVGALQRHSYRRLGSEFGALAVTPDSEEWTRPLIESGAHARKRRVISHTGEMLTLVSRVL